MHDLIPGDQISNNIAFNGFYDLDLTRRIAERARKGGLLVDVGANMGYFSLLWAGSSPKARAIAFEVAPRNLRLIENNVDRNGLGQQVTLIPKAASKQSGPATFLCGPAAQTGWGGLSTAARTDEAIIVPAVRIDEHLGDSTIDVLKIDVEGADTWVLFGCEKLLQAKRIGAIYFEQNTTRMAQLGIRSDDARTFLGDMGYACEPLDPLARDWIAYPRTARQTPGATGN